MEEKKEEKKFIIRGDKNVKIRVVSSTHKVEVANE